MYNHLVTLTLSRYPSLSSIALSRSFQLHPVFTPSCCKYLLFSQNWCVYRLESMKGHF